MAYDDDAFSRALLMAGLGMMGRGNTWDKISQGGMFGVQAYDQALTEKERRKLMAAKLRDEELQAKAREVAMARQQSVAAIYGGGAAPQGAAPQGSPAPMGNPPPPRNVGQMLLDAGFVDEAEKFGKARKSLQDEVLPDVKVGIDGTPYLLTKTGKPMPLDKAFTPREKLHFADAGGRAAVGMDPFTGQERSPGVAKTMTPSERDTSARGWQGLSLQRQQLEKADVEKPPQGFRWNPDRSGLEAIPGGPADIKTGEKAEAMAKRQQSALERADFVLSKVGDAVKKTGFMSTGVMGQLTRDVGGSPAFNLAKTIDPIKANIGFAELQAMREASPTGGALGQVAVQELNMLQSVLGSLDTAQGQDELLQSLYAIEKHFNNWKRAVKQAQNGTTPGPKADAPKPAALKVGDEEDGYVYLGGDKGDPRSWKKK